MLTQVFDMIEMRIVIIGDGCRPEFQYRYKLPQDERYNELDKWSEWKTAPYVKAEEIEKL
jgi:hypothetical protein